MCGGKQTMNSGQYFNQKHNHLSYIDLQSDFNRPQLPWPHRPMQDHVPKTESQINQAQAKWLPKE